MSVFLRRIRRRGWPVRRGQRRGECLLLLLAAPPSPFIQSDIDLLRRHFRVEVLIYQNRRLQMAWRVLYRILAGDVGAILFWFVVPSFGFGVSLVARLLRCPIVLITGGYDIANMPEIGFGAMIRPKLRLLVIAMLRMARTVLPFSEDAKQEVLRYARPPRLVTAYPAVDVQRFRPVPDRTRECLVVTASFSVGRSFVKQKGLDVFVQAASFVPEARFVLIGQFVDDSGDDLKSQAPSNVEFTERRVSDEELVDMFQRARVYVQASAHEGFGVALGEAMAAGCVPVVVPATAMPEVVGDTGIYAPFGDAKAFGEAIRQALRDDGRLSRAARERIANNFTLAHRERVLVSEIGRFIKPHSYLSSQLRGSDNAWSR